VSRNLDVVRTALGAFSRGDADTALRLVHPEIVSRRLAPLPDPHTYHGPDGVLAMYADWTADFGEFELDPLEPEQVGDQVLMGLHQTARGRVSGVPVEGTYWFLFTVEDGLIVHQDAFATREQALASSAQEG
jgi:ketosteroid isomerase-like protein